MFKKCWLLMVLSWILVVPATALSAENSAVRIGVAMKTGHQSPAITLASNDIVQMQNSASRNVTATKYGSDDITESPNLPAQAWFILAALLLLCDALKPSHGLKGVARYVILV